MFRTKLTLASLAVAALAGAAAPGALAAHDSWYSYATSLTNSQQHDPWFAYAVSLTQAQHSAPFITDTLAHGGTAPTQSYRFITDTLAPGGGTSVVSVPASSGFDWADAGIGAGAMAGIGALLLGSARLLQRRNVVAV